MALKHSREGAERSTPWAYRTKQSPVHRIPAGIKLLALPVLSLVILRRYDSPVLSILPLALAVLLIGAVSLAAKIRPWELLAGSRPLIVTLGAVTLLRAVSGQDFAAGIFFAAALLVSFCAGALLFATSTMTELCAALGRAELFLLKIFYRFRARRQRPRLSLAVALMLAFIPRFFVSWEDAVLACEGRGKKAGLDRIRILLPLTIERLMKNAAETAAALESRGFGDILYP
ncbi:MAG: energy-coupling factor transporter transmembrane protein EcfT [Treponema sp.]|jgi:biotin transport system permease protein|nr:energy-coupling factor transporter transmembrane protein EcfT [Treponema sp.]